MLQNATGKYYDEAFWNLKVSVHGGFESIFWNYGQMIKGNTNLEGSKLMNQGLPLYGASKTSQRTPINMQELYNGHLWIFIKAEDDFPYWTELKESLESPKKTLSLGRSEDVIFLKEVQEIENSEIKKVENNLRLVYPMYLRNDLPIRNQQYPVYSFPTKVLFKNDEKVISTRTELSKKTKRESTFSTVVYTGLNFTAYVSKQMDVEVFEYNGKRFKIPVQHGWI